MQTSRAPGRALAMATALVAAFLTGDGARAARTAAAAPDSVAAGSDSLEALPTYRLPPIPVRADRISPEERLRELPGQTSWLDLQPFRLDLTNTAQVLDRVPGLFVQEYGSLGHLATATIRGSSSSQVSVYLDGVPLTRGGAGLVNLAELPFSGIENIEVYRGFSPAALPGSSTGGAINLVSSGIGTLPGRTASSTGSRSVLRLGAGSFDTRRFGFSHVHRGSTWNVLVSADALQSDGDFEFFDDNGTPWNPNDDDHLTPRRNNWLRSEEALARVQAPWHGILWTLINHWVHRKQGVAGISSYQSDTAQLGLHHNLTNLHLALPESAGGRLRSSVRLFHDWRRDTFVDPDNRIGLGFQDNRDITRSYGTQLFLEARLPLLQTVSALTQWRQETFDAWRRYPSAGSLPQQSRAQVELTLGERWTTSGERLALQGTLRLSRESDLFTDDLKGLYSRTAARSDSRQFVEPHIGLRLRLLPGLHAEATYGEVHRSPSFLELFGDSGSVAGSSDLVPEEGTNRDVGLEGAVSLVGWRLHGEATHFRNRVDHLIVFLPQSQRTFVARNIGSARMQGEEFTWSLRSPGTHRWWKLSGNLTRQRTEDLGVDRTWYAGNALPGRPELQAFTRLQVAWGHVQAAWQFDHLGGNYLDQANLESVPQRDRHGLDLTLDLQGVRLRAAVRNLNDNKDVDVRGFPLPGRTWSLMSEMGF